MNVGVYLNQRQQQPTKISRSISGHIFLQVLLEHYDKAKVLCLVNIAHFF